jgi:predicted tellurium resistance membrane protein TerC
MAWLELFRDPQTYVSLLALTSMEIVLGIDNIVFITILAGALPAERQHFARRVGISVALISRLALLFALSWIMGLTRPLFEVWGHPVSGRDLILLVGGLFLMAKATHEIYHTVEHSDEPAKAVKVAVRAPSLWTVVTQVILLDVVFSLDSVITAVGMVRHVPIMVAAVVLSVIVMLVFVGPVGDFVQRHASIRVLALAFLILIGVLLLADGLGRHVPKGYIYFAMAFSLIVELINMRMRKRRAAAEP